MLLPLNHTRVTSYAHQDFVEIFIYILGTISTPTTGLSSFEDRQA